MGKEQPPPYVISGMPGLQSESPRQDFPQLQQLSLPDQSLSSGDGPQKLNWWKDLKRNKSQCSSLAAAVIIFTSGGMSLAWGLGFVPELSEPLRTHMQICWFLAVMIGACLATVFINILEKRIFNLWASGLVFINGILFVSALPGSSFGIIFARYCDGLAVGLTIVTAIVAGSEQAVKRFRGVILSAESIGIMTGIMLQTICVSSWNTNWEVSLNQTHGIMKLILGASALVCTCFLTIESPLFFLCRQNEYDAHNCLEKLHTSTDSNYDVLQEYTELLKEDRTRQHLENMIRSYVPMLKLCCYRALVCMSFSLSLNWGFLMTSKLMGDYDHSYSYIYGIMRLTGVLVTAVTVDTVGRRALTAIVMFIGGGLLMVVGSMFSNSDNLCDENQMQTTMAILMAYQFLAGAAAPASSIYLGEAFSVSVKPVFILIVVIFENVIQMISCFTFEFSAKSVAHYSFMLGTFQLLFAICFGILMPETKQTTLRMALQRFKRNLNTDIQLLK